MLMTIGLTCIINNKLTEFRTLPALDEKKSIQFSADFKLFRKDTFTKFSHSIIRLLSMPIFVVNFKEELTIIKLLENKRGITQINR